MSSAPTSLDSSRQRSALTKDNMQVSRRQPYGSSQTAAIGTRPSPWWLYNGCLQPLLLQEWCGTTSTKGGKGSLPCRALPAQLHTAPLPSAHAVREHRVHRQLCYVTAALQNCTERERGDGCLNIMFTPHSLRHLKTGYLMQTLICCP